MGISRLRPPEHTRLYSHKEMTIIMLELINNNEEGGKKKKKGNIKDIRSLMFVGTASVSGPLAVQI